MRIKPRQKDRWQFLFLLVCFLQRPADPVVGANVTFATCTNGTVLSASSTGLASYTFGPADCDGNGFTAECDATGASGSSMNRLVISTTSGVNILRFNRTGATAIITKGRLFSTSHARFKLTNLTVYPNNNTNQTLTVTAFAGGAAISGSAIIINYTNTPTIHGTTLTSTDFGSNYNNIDEIQITSDQAVGIAITNIQTAASLPITLLSFTGSRENDQVVLNWTTALESNNDHFEVERQTTGGSWTGIGQIPGHGTVSTEQFYRFVDPRPLAGTDNYRLKQVDLDGRFAYSFVVAVKIAGDNRDIILSPNPVRNELFLTVSNTASETAIITIRNMEGAIVLHQAALLDKGPNRIILTGLQDLPGTLYVLTLSTPSRSSRIPFLKEN